MIVNCTKQDISIITNDGIQHTIPTSGIIPWVEIEKEIVAQVEVSQGVVLPVYRERLVMVKNIPEREDGVWYIVSAKIADYMPERDDFIIPNLLKDAGGRALGITSFRQKQLMEEQYG
jgi:hypothetical protein